MKSTKIFSIIFAILFALSSVQVVAFASDMSKDEGFSTHMAGDVTILFNEKVSPETQAKIHAHFNGEEPAPGAKGLTCTLFGHKLETGTTITVTHKARATAPRCLQETFTYEICTRCDYSKYTLIGSKYIYCCS